MARLKEVRSQLIAYCRHGLYERGSLEDVIQTVLSIAYEKYDEFQPGTNYRAWLFRIANNVVCNANRGNKRVADRTVDVEFEELDVVKELQREYSYDELLRDPDRILNEVGDEFYSVLQELPEKELRVFLLKAICELRCQEIAEILGMPVGSAMGYLARARGKLRGRIAEYARSLGFISDEVKEELSNGLSDN